LRSAEKNGLKKDILDKKSINN